MPRRPLIPLPRTPEELDELSRVDAQAFDAARAWADEFLEEPFNTALDAEAWEASGREPQPEA